jgi:transcriptional regulator with XRE-family HTH domain
MRWTKNDTTEAKHLKLSEKIRILRLERKWSQRELARQSGITHNQIAKYERGESLPGTEALKKLGEVLRVTSDYLIEMPEEQDAVVMDKELKTYMKAIEKMPEDYKNAAKIVLKSMIESLSMKKRRV